jgi:signal transduction histidine kinase
VRRRAGAIALTVSVLTLLLVAATAALFTVDGAIGADPVSNVLVLVAVSCYAIVGGLIATRLPRNACGWLLLLIGFGLVATTGSEAASTVALADGRLELARWALWLNSWLLIATVWPGIVLYLLEFPTGALPSRRWRPVVFAVLALAAIGSGARMVQTYEGEPFTNPLAVPDAASIVETVFAIVSLAFAAALILAVVSVVLRFRRASRQDRQALRWLVVASVLSASLLVVAIGAGALGLHQIGDPFGVAFLLSLILGLPSSAAIALLGHHVRGIEFLASRSIVYAALAAFVTAIYAVVVGVAGVALAGESVLPAVAATAIAAIVFQPARRRAHRFADRIVYGDRASPYDLVATFTERLDQVSLPEILPHMASLVAEGTGAQRVGIWLRSDGELHAVAGWPSGDALPSPEPILGDEEVPRLNAGYAFAVRDREDLLGAISVDMPPQEPMTPVTERLLADLSGQAALVLRNIALVDELQRSRHRLVATQDEERRRLERDLHDGAQQRLVTLSMDLRMARDRAAARGDVELTTRLTAAEQELARSLAELRELARGIHPAILTQSGLGGALRSLAERSAVPASVRSVPERRFTPEVEATAYFFVSEALANVAKHAGATRAWVAVEDGGERLAIEVGDDGVGGARMNGGSGLRGLADRVEAAGGRIDVRSEPGSGTTLRAEIPCA